MSKNYAYLICVDAIRNSNKYYELTENDDGSLDATYGRVGGKALHKHYESWEKDFHGLRNEKENKGYEDVTALHAEASKDSNEKLKEELSYQEIPDEAVNEVVQQLITSFRDFMEKNYTISVSEITPKMVSEAERDIADLQTIANNGHANSLWEFNQKLQELFTDIPRKMQHVHENIAASNKDFNKIISRETDMLDNIKGQLVQTVSQDTQHLKKQNALEAYGLTMRPVTYKEEDRGARLMMKRYYKRIYLIMTNEVIFVDAILKNNYIEGSLNTSAGGGKMIFSTKGRQDFEIFPEYVEEREGDLFVDENAIQYVFTTKKPEAME